MSFVRRVLRPVGLLLALCLVAGVVVAGTAFPAVGGLGLVATDASDSVNTVSTDLVDGPLPQTSTVTDSAGTPIAWFFEDTQNRRSVAAEDINPAMKAAIVAIEDRRFYQHNGVDWQGTIRAVVTNSTSGEIRQGASTLTQQYVKNYFLYVDAETETERLKATEQTPARKLREAQIALQMERNLGKDEILTRYLNIVSFGNGAAGIATAARTYFDTTPDQLTVPQAALLAGMVQSTTAFDPVTKPDAALERRNIVIEQMREQLMIDDAQADAALDSPLGIVSPLVTQPNGCIGAGDSGFFCQYLFKYLLDRGMSEEQVEEGGYTIRTTLDRNVMDKMRAALLAEVPAQQPQVANVMAVVEPGSDRHRVLGLASNRTFGLDGDALETSYGLPYEPVPPGAGSIYKMFTAATALEKGLGINYQMAVPPSGYLSPAYLNEQSRPIPVRNASMNLPPRMTLTDALAQSPNTAFVKLIEFTGVPDVVDMAVRLGMRTLDKNIDLRSGRSYAETIKQQRRASFTLGVDPTSVLDLANVGSTLASAGTWCEASPIESITGPDGAPVPLVEAPCEQVVEPGLANALLTAMSKDGVSPGTAARAAGEVGWNRPFAAKTGTTQSNRSAAFFGVVPQLSGAVITFDDSPRPEVLCDGAGSPVPCGQSGGDLFGGKTPAETWFGTMVPLLEGQEALPLPPVEERYLEGGAETRVPGVLGRGQNEARDTLEAAGWQVTTETVDNAASRGIVIGQSPTGSALPGETVVLTLSSGSVAPPPDPPGDGEPDEGEQEPPPDDEGDGG